MRIFVGFLLVAISSASVATSTDEECVDKIAHCTTMRDVYAACDPSSQHYKYMEPNCPETCGLCVVHDQPVCEDLIAEADCQQIIEHLDGCSPDSRVYVHMRVSCIKSCGLCTLDADIQDDEPIDCVDTLTMEGHDDTAENCFQFARYCEDGPGWMVSKVQEGCRSTCGLC